MDLKEYNHKQSKKQFNAIVFFHYLKGIAPKKYRGITKKEKFEAFAKTLNALYINYYHKETKEFDCRVWITHYEKKQP